MSASGLLAYIGPGPGLTMVWAFLGLLGTIALAILSLLMWPIRMLFRYIRGQKEPEAEPVTTQTAEQSSDTASQSAP